MSIYMCCQEKATARDLGYGYFVFSVCVRRGRERRRASWRCGGRGLRGSGNRRCRAGGRGVAGESWIASLDRRGDRGRRRASEWAAGRVRLPWWRATVRRVARRGGRGLGGF